MWSQENLDTTNFLHSSIGFVANVVDSMNMSYLQANFLTVSENRALRIYCIGKSRIEFFIDCDILDMCVLTRFV